MHNYIILIYSYMIICIIQNVYNMLKIVPNYNSSIIVVYNFLVD